ncbi:Penicillin acylase [Waddlia chondrophila WSU 86-1044]|uniref:Penicillin acylase n=3 Tax=Waddlia chondrophila TaxID=71667 RepID=D6YUT1_WADCW|nr:linear amide C-N hydrolase [Waddlia chondrophila]ADI37892.1 Penicillin acylase [Waddlia chondrophila WSU 86-1044]
MCTRILWNTNHLAVVTGRSMDWPEPTQPQLMVLPRGMKRDGGRLGPEVVVEENPLQWTSKYGSIVVTIYGLGSVDGLNEEGLGMHLLFLTATDYGPRDRSKQGVQAMLWGQYLLDNASTVEEAIELVEQIQPVMVGYAGYKSSVHLAIEDRLGDSAVIEYVEGKPRIYHGKHYQVMTNDPPYDQQLDILKTYDFSNATRETPLPGNVDPVSRFVRANYFLQTQREPKSEREAIAAILSISRNTSVPFNSPNKDPGTIYDTEYRTVLDSTNQRYFFELTTSPNLVWAELAKFDLSSNASAFVVNPDNITLSGDISKKFEEIQKNPF